MIDADKIRNGSFFLFFILLLILEGCSSSSSFTRRPYRDPVTYSFEAYTPYQEEDPLFQLLGGVRETSRQIRDWEKKHLW